MFGSTIADMWSRLMSDRLGYQPFGAHGSDIGSAVTIELARRHPDRLLGVHLSAFYVETPPQLWPPAIRDFFAARDRERVEEGDTPRTHEHERLRCRRWSSAKPRRTGEATSNRTSRAESLMSNQLAEPSRQPTRPMAASGYTRLVSRR